MASEKTTINSVIKCFNILECFSRDVKELKLTEIAKKLDMPKSTTSNLVYTLQKIDYIKQNHDNGKYRLGAKLFILGKLFEYHTNIIEISKPYMEMLRNKFNENVQLSIPYINNDVIEEICIDEIESFNVLGMHSQVGKKSPAYYTASGKLFLSHMPEITLKRTLENIELHKNAGDTATMVEALRKEINDIKVKGYSLNIEEGEIGITSIATPIYNYYGNIVASICIAAPTVRISGEIRNQVTLELIKVSKQISEKLGFI